MCCDGKCLGCIPVEIGSLIFGIISAIATLALFVGWLVLGGLVGYGFFNASNDLDHAADSEWPWWSDWSSETRDASTATSYLAAGSMLFIFLTSIPALIAFIFSVLLCNGICKRRPGQVMAYFVFGVIGLSLEMIFAFIEMVSIVFIANSLVTLFLCAIYALILVMVFQTYKKIGKLNLNAGGLYATHGYV